MTTIKILPVRSVEDKALVWGLNPEPFACKADVITTTLWNVFHLDFLNEWGCIWFSPKFTFY